MDNFEEQLVEKRRTGADTAKKILISAAALILASFFMYLALSGLLTMVIFAVLTVDISQAEDFAPYPPENEINADATVHAYTGSDVDAYYLLVNHSGYGRVKLIFNPNKKMREAIMQELPNTLRIKLRNNNDR